MIDPLSLLGLGMMVVVGGILLLRLHAFLALLLAGLVVGGLTTEQALRRHASEKKMSSEAAQKFVVQPLGQRIAAEFGNVCGKIGLLIALASVIGKCLLESGAADRVIRSALRWLGEPRAPLAFWGGGFVLGIPVFFDTVFYLLVPLAKALRLRSGRNFTLYIMAICLGATMTHSLVPPTPGPLFVASQLGVGVGLMMAGGIVIGGLAGLGGYIYALWINRRMDIPLRDSSDTPVAELEAVTRRTDDELPPLWLALLPIGLPVLLIGGDAVLRLWTGSVFSPALKIPLAITGVVGDPNIALMLAALVGIGLLFVKRPPGAKPLGAALQDALAGGGVIILVTAAGGAFGAMLQQAGVGSRIEQLALEHQVGVLPLAWGVTALIRMAQGSATVAMITATGMVAGLANAETLGFHPLYVALAIGCGSKPFPWMNDSGFWVMTRMSGMTVGESLRVFSGLLTVLGVAGLLLVMLAARWFPLV